MPGDLDSTVAPCEYRAYLLLDLYLDTLFFNEKNALLDRMSTTCINEQYKEDQKFLTFFVIIRNFVLEKYVNSQTFPSLHPSHLL